MKKTLTILPPEERTDAPALQKRGRGWNIAESRLDTIHEAARAAKRNPSPAQELLGAKLIEAELGKYKFKRQTVIGSAIVDFACQPLKLVVLIDEGGDPALSQRRDKSLEAVGLQVLRFAADRILAEADEVTAEIVAALKQRYEQQRARPRPPRRTTGYSL